MDPMERRSTDMVKHIFAAKGPVCLCGLVLGCDGQCGPQRTAQRALDVLRARGVALPEGWSAARDHAFMGEGRGEWDALMAAAGW
jgi:hypothetical protein